MSSETNNDPDVAVDELMRRVRQEVERRHLAMRMQSGSRPVVVDDEVAASWQATTEALDAAEASTAVGMRLPPMTQMRGLKRRIAEPVARVILRAAQLVTRDQTAYNRLILELVRMLAGTSHERFSGTEGRIDALADGLAQAVAQGRAIPELLDAGARAAAELRLLREEVGALEDRGARLEAAVADLARQLDDARRADQARSADAERLRAEQARTLAFLERRIAEAPVARPAAMAAPSTDGAVSRLSDAFYVDFEDRFRGGRDEVKRRVEVYLEVIAAAEAGTPDRPVLDVGCGRGEWLELLRERGLVGRGVDLNDLMVSECRALGLDAIHGDALEHLRSLPDASLGAVTGMHVIEHMPFTSLVEMLDECLRVLQPGGVVIFETPNPQNLLVGACQFYLDPTHRRPLHPQAMEFVAEQRGLTRVRVMPLHPVDEAYRLRDADSPIARLLNEQLFGPQDFAVVGHRP